MKIAFNILRTNYGGGERVIIALAKELLNKGENVIFVTWNNGLLENELPAPVYYFDDYSSSISFPKIVSKYIKVKSLFQRETVDCVVAFGYDPYIFLAAHHLNIKSIFSLRIDPLDLSTDLLSTLCQKIVYRNATFCVFQTEVVYQSMPFEVRKKSVVIPNPILTELPEPKSLECRKPYIVCVGRLSEEKNQALLLKAYAKIPKCEYRVMLFGKGLLEEPLKKLAESLSISDSVEFKGYSYDVISDISDSEIFVLPSNSEGMPNALIEAMAMKLACVSTDVSSGGSRFLINGDNGILIPVGDSEALSSALRMLIENKELRRKCQENAYNIRKQLDKTKIVNMWLELMYK